MLVTDHPRGEPEMARIKNITRRSGARGGRRCAAGDRRKKQDFMLNGALKPKSAPQPAKQTAASKKPQPERPAPKRSTQGTRSAKVFFNPKGGGGTLPNYGPGQQLRVLGEKK